MIAAAAWQTAGPKRPQQSLLPSQAGGWREPRGWLAAWRPLRRGRRGACRSTRPPIGSGARARSTQGGCGRNHQPPSALVLLLPRAPGGPCVGRGRRCSSPPPVWALPPVAQQHRREGARVHRRRIVLVLRNAGHARPFLREKGGRHAGRSSTGAPTPGVRSLRHAPDVPRGSLVDYARTAYLALEAVLLPADPGALMPINTLTRNSGRHLL
jgi:hypothetical protein